MATSGQKSAKLKANIAKKQLFTDHDAVLIDDIRRELDAPPGIPADIKLTFEKAVATVILRRTQPSSVASHGALAELAMAIAHMTQEAAFGLDIKFPPRVQHLADKPISQLTEAECKRLAKAGIEAHRKALGLR